MRGKTLTSDALTPIDLGIAQLQALGFSVPDIADQLGLGEQAVKARMRRRPYQEAINGLRNQMAERTLDKLNFAMGAATDYLTKVVMDESEETNVRVRSARAVLQTVAQFAGKGLHSPTGAVKGAQDAAETIQEAFNENPEALELILAAEEALEREATIADG